MTISSSEVETFKLDLAPKLARRAGAKEKWSGRSGGFDCFDGDSFAVIVGPQQVARADQALAYGLTWAKGRPLAIFLPRGHDFPTSLRTAWLTRTTRPNIYTYDERGEATRSKVPTPKESLERFEVILKRTGAKDFEEELDRASKPKHLGKRSDYVPDLVEWATKLAVLDAAHRRSERSWHCVGQRVLSITTPVRGTLRIKAGIHVPECWSTNVSESLTEAKLSEIKRRVIEGIDKRLNGSYKKADEAWLQAVIRREPTSVGIEPPALREVPVWRPVTPKKAGDMNWRRGFIDLLGLDANGDLRIVETKLAKSIAGENDPMLVLQGLDYYIWALVYRDALRRRLGASTRWQTFVHFVLGASLSGASEPSHYVKAQAAALNIPWKFQVVRGWFKAPARVPSLNVKIFDDVPSSIKSAL